MLKKILYPMETLNICRPVLRDYVSSLKKRGVVVLQTYKLAIFAQLGLGLMVISNIYALISLRRKMKNL